MSGSVPTPGALLPSVPSSAKASLQLVLATTIGSERSAALADAFREIYVLAAALFFLLTPSPVANVGFLLLSLGHPLLRSIAAIGTGAAHRAVDDSGASADDDRGGSALTRRAAAQKGRRRPPPSADARSADEPAQIVTAEAEAASASAVNAQLRYWLCYAMLLAALRVFEPLLRWIPFVTHAKLLFVLWLQLPVLRALTRMASALLPALRLVLGLRARSAESTPSLTDASDDDAVARAPRANALYSSRLSQRSSSATASAKATTDKDKDK